MQYINNMSDTDINPSLPQDTTIAVPDYRTLSSEDNSNDTQSRADNHTGIRMLRHIINEPGPTHNVVYNHIVRELLGIAPGTTINNLLVARLRGHQDTISLKYFIMDLDRDSNYNWINSLKADGLIDETQQDELLIIDSYLNFMQNRTGLICDGYADITKCTRDDFVKFTKMDTCYGCSV